MNSIHSFGRFSRRHIGTNPADALHMLSRLGLTSLEELVEKAIPPAIRMQRPLDLPPARTEEQALEDLRQMIEENEIFTSYIGMGYYDCITPPVIRRNVLENPGWYTAYTPYQSEISQGRMEALLNFQTLIADMTGLEIANASLLDEATAAAEAMAMCHAARSGRFFLVDRYAHPQTIALLRTRAEPHGWEIVEFDPFAAISDPNFHFPVGTFGVLLQYPNTLGRVYDPSALIALARRSSALTVMSCDPLALAIFRSPGEWGVDIAVGSAQRFGVPLGYGGPHAAFLATREEHKRRLPGRLIGVSRDSENRPALRLTLQTREQHIRREKATSNICTAQVLLAVMASSYAVYHGPQGIKAIANRIHRKARALAAGLRKLGWDVAEGPFFDTVHVRLGHVLSSQLQLLAESHRMNLRIVSPSEVTISLDETTTTLEPLMRVFHFGQEVGFDAEQLDLDPKDEVPAVLLRETTFLDHPVFNSYHTETEMLRYLRRLESRDLSLTTSMIPLGSCTMKLNAAAEMQPLTWEKVARVHPFAPPYQARGYHRLFSQLEKWLTEITGLAACSLQPNAGSQGEYAGLLVIRAWHRSRGEHQRTVCLIPTSAHGTNPASAAMAGYRVVAVKCDANGNISLEDLRAKLEEHGEQVGAMMITYPSTHGVFEENIREVCEMVHAVGGQVYLDGANMNALVGLCRPGDFGADVCHLNLHKTFCIPHGGGGPGAGPICVAEHLVPFLPNHPVIPTGGEQSAGTISAAPWGSASIFVIPWMYIAMMGPDGLAAATAHSILHANYIAARLSPPYKVLYRGRNGLVAHECILDLREWKARAGIEVEDVAKRLMDYGFHAPTMSWPVPGTLMIEPTESESLEEIDRFCDAMLLIHEELLKIESGEWSRTDNPLKNAPHPAHRVASSHWPHCYSRETAAYPAPWLREHKFWPHTSRVDNVFGDKHVFCTCLPADFFATIETNASALASV